MKLRRFLFPDARWNAPRGPQTVVNLTRPGFDRVAVPTLVVVPALVLSLVSGVRVGLGFLGVAAFAGAVAAVSIRQHARPGEAALIADADHLVYASRRLVGLRGAATSFVAITSDGVRLIDADSYAAVPWRVIRQASLHRQGRHSWLCLAVDAEAPADIAWAVLRAALRDQVVPGCSVLRLPLPAGSAHPSKLQRALWQGGRVRFDSTSWPDTPVAHREDT